MKQFPISLQFLKTHVVQSVITWHLNDCSTLLLFTRWYCALFGVFRLLLFSPSKSEWCNDISTQKLFTSQCFTILSFSLYLMLCSDPHKLPPAVVKSLKKTFVMIFQLWRCWRAIVVISLQFFETHVVQSLKTYHLNYCSTLKLCRSRCCAILVCLESYCVVPPNFIIVMIFQL